MSNALPSLIIALLLSTLVQARAEDRIRVGIAAPLSGAAQILGEQVLAGVRTAADGMTDVTSADTACSADGGSTAAATLIAARVEIAVGFICTEALAAALPKLSAAGIPVITVGVRANRFTDTRAKTGALIWRLAPRSDAEADAAAALLVARWRDVPFGLVDDGTIYGRGLADAVRMRLEAAGLRPATIDNYRPAEEKQFGLVRRLLATGVTRIFLAGDRPDVAIIARDAASLGLDLDIVGGEALLDEGSPDARLGAGALAVGPQNRFDDIPTAEARPEARQGYFGPAVAGTEVALAAIRFARQNARPLPDVLGANAFATSLGPIGFDAKGDSDLKLFRTFRFDGQDFIPEAGG